MMQISIIKQTDAPTLESLSARAFTTQHERPWNAQEYCEILNARGYGWIITKDNDACGFILLQDCVDYQEIMKIAVDPAHRRIGIGSRLLDIALQGRKDPYDEMCHAHEDMQSKTCYDTRFLLEVAENNEEALSLYERFGFKNIGKRPKYYTCPPKDCERLIRTSPYDSVASSQKSLDLHDVNKKNGFKDSTKYIDALILERLVRDPK
jgi:ribosomal-protein-alanine N-acetyltransferase